LSGYLKIEEELRQLKTGWWKRVVDAVPELAALAGTPQMARYHAEGDVAVHTKLAVEACADDCDPDLLWAALLHDVGKPEATKEIGGRIRSPGHDVVGAEVAAKVLTRLGLPRQRRDRIVWVIRHHIFHFSWNLNAPEEASRRQRRFAADPRFPLLVALLGVDAAASLVSSRKREAYGLYKRLGEMVRNS